MSDEHKAQREELASSIVPVEALSSQQLHLPLDVPTSQSQADPDIQLHLDPCAEPPESALLTVSEEELAPPFDSIFHPVDSAPMVRTPNLLDLLLFIVLLFLGILVSTGGVGLAIYFHWFGLKDTADAARNTMVTLATEVLWYGVALAASIPIFGAVWRRGFFNGIHWHGDTALRLRYRLMAAAVGCNLLAMIGSLFLHFPEHAPVDKLFDSTRDAWLIFAFGVTIAPFFEELGFRGFLLPAIATAWDWCGERMSGAEPRPLDAQGNPVWSRGAAIFAALVVSAPFAWMHAEQVGKAWGPIALLYCVSLVLCAVRSITRSLAASTLVHSTYNFLLFSMMFFQTDGFRHLDKM